MDWVLFGGFTLLLLAGVPLAAALGLAGSVVILLGGQGIIALPNSVYTSIAKYPSPSIALIIYSLLVPQASVPALFAAGLLPGILAGIAVMVMARGLSARHGLGTELRDPPPALWQSLTRPSP
jgi:TRAP-type C4-dicarboxylate transport system permease large subunit